MFNRLLSLASRLVTVVVVILGLVLPTAYAADPPSARLYLSPDSASVNPGAALFLDLRVNVENDSANIIWASINYPANMLEYLSVVDSSACAIPANSSGGGGNIKVTRGCGSPRDGGGWNGIVGSQVVVTINFQVKTTLGSATITIDQSNSGVGSNSSNTNILSSVGNGSYTVSQPTAVPPTTSSIAPNQISPTSPNSSQTTPKQQSPTATDSAATDTKSASFKIPNGKVSQSEDLGIENIMKLLGALTILCGALALRIINRKYRTNKTKHKGHKHYSKKGETVAELAARINRPKTKKHKLRRASKKGETVAELAARINRSL